MASFAQVQECLLLIPPLDIQNVEEFGVKIGGNKVVVRASSEYEAAFKTAVVICDKNMFEPSVVVERENGDKFEYAVATHIAEDRTILPRVTLLRMEKKGVHNGNESADVDNPTYTHTFSNAADPTDANTDDFLDAVLRNVFGHNSFKPNQKETIVSTLSGKNVLSVISTGGGKSLTFMLPSAISSKPTVVISPIRALIDDMYDRATNVGLKSCVFKGGMATEDIKSQLNAFREFKLVLTTPEMLIEHLLDDINSLDKDQNIDRIVFDEAHTISTWGSTFRPDYRDAAEKMANLNAPTLLLSATVSFRIQDDLKSIFGSNSWEVKFQSVYRENLTLEVESKGTKFYDQLNEFIGNHRNDSGILYCVLPNDVAKIHAELRKRGVECVKYHGQLSEELKTQSFQTWMNGDCNLIVANSSFGMGIDKPDVRYIIHAFLPTSIEDYYQQCGRAGRDGLPAVCKLFYNYSDKTALYKLFRKGDHDCLQQYKAVRDLVVLLEDPVQCRHKLVMNYFGEEREEFRCITACDNCKNRGYCTTDGTDDALKVLQTMVEIGNRTCSCNLLKLVLQGSRQKSVLTNSFDSLSNFGCFHKQFVPAVLLDKFLHLLIHNEILAEEVIGTSAGHNSLNVRVILGPRAHNLMALNFMCTKYVKI